MTEQERLAKLAEILADLLGEDSVHLTMQTVRDDVPGWDSFAYINFIVATEAAFGIKFRIAEVESFANVGAIVRAIGTARPR